MEVFVCEPHGLCSGVRRALAIAKKCHDDEMKDVHILGPLVHNETLLESLRKDGFILHSEENKALKEEMLQIEDGSNVIFAAHGHSKELDDIAERKHFNVFDSTCPFVSSNANIILSAIGQGKDVIYIGLKNHAECEAALSLSNHIFLYDMKDSSNQSWKGVSGESPEIVIQTTLGEAHLMDAINEIKLVYPKAHLASRPCLATTERQEAVKMAPKDITAFIVLGSKTSHNTEALCSTIKEKYPEATLVRALDLEELKQCDFPHYGTAALTSGASSPEEVFMEVEAYLKSL